MRGQVVGVELPGVDRRRAGGFEHVDLLSELIGPAGGQHDRRAPREESAQLDPDLAAAAQDYYWTRTRVVHGCDYHLR
ncbi:hypothetical protein MUNTM_36110 [Mycobacterium sp. MUNTM1]